MQRVGRQKTCDKVVGNGTGFSSAFRSVIRRIAADGLQMRRENVKRLGEMRQADLRLEKITREIVRLALALV